jgi:hypothetical protein
MNEIKGTPQTRVTSAFVSLKLPEVEEVISVTTTGSNKKIANSKCALEVIRKLHQLGFIEDRGEPEKKIEKKKKTVLNEVFGQKLFGAQGTKRKASEDGNWTKGTFLSNDLKLHIYFRIGFGTIREVSKR